MKKYLLSLLAFGFGLSMSAQVMYTDIADVTILAANSDSYPLDMDNNASPEMVVYGTIIDTVVIIQTTFTGAAITTLSSTGIHGFTSTIGTETVLEADSNWVTTAIGSSLNYINSSTPSVFPGVGIGVNESQLGQSFGNFLGLNDRYVGVEFDIAGSMHYGWIRVDMSANGDTCIIKDYAYEATAGVEILAGDMGSQFVEVEEELPVNLNIYNVGSDIHIQGDELNGTAVIFNLIGKEIVTAKINQSTVVDLSNQPKGIYLVSYTQGTERITKKVLLR